jgi:ribosomal-protein-serine acetyltransferase
MDKDLRSHFYIGDDITLRTYTPSDADLIYNAAIQNRERLAPFMHWMTDAYSLSSATDFIERNAKSFAEKSSVGYGIFRESELLGSTGFVYFDWATRKTEIGYWLIAKAEGKGIVSTVCKVLIDYAFNDLEMNRIEIKCSVENLRSAAVAERLGFKKEAHLRQAEFRQGEFHDYYIFGLLAADPRSN